MVLGRFNTLQMVDFDSRAAIRLMAVLQGSTHYIGLRSILEAEFGFCIHHGKEGLEFFPRLPLLEMLYDEKKALALPYLLDHDPFTN